jgi:autonomous glycyl radical cofactor GrcA
MRNDTENSFEQSHRLSQQQTDDAVSPYEVTAILEEGGIKYVLIGGHVLGYLTGSPRATVDVDVIVSNAHLSKAVKAIKARFPQLTSEDLGYNVRFNSGRSGHVDAERIDLVKAGNLFFQRILERYAAPIQSKGQRVYVPTVEAAIALKFAAAISPNRGDESRPQDRIDLLAIVRKHPNLNQATLAELGDLVYAGGGVELQTFVRDVQAGKNVVI